MSEINFLGDNQNNKKPDGFSDGNQKAPENIAWTNPEKLTKDDDTINKIKDRLKFVDKRDNKVNEVNIAANKGIDLPIKNEPVHAAAPKLSFWKKLFRSGRETADEKHLLNFKQGKEMISNYGNIINTEKNVRKNSEETKTEEMEVKQAIQVKPENKDKVKSSGLNKWRAPKILKTDLIKDEAVIYINWGKNLKYLFTNLFLVFVIIAIAYSGLLYWGSSSAQQVKSLDNEIIGLSGKIMKSKTEVKEIDNFQKKLGLVEKLLNNHIYWTNFFDFIEKNTLSDIRYKDGFSGDTSGRYNFSATAPSYKEMADQVRVFKADQNNVTGVEVTGGKLAVGDDKKGSQSAADKTSIEFNMGLSLNPKIFLK